LRAKERWNDALIAYKRAASLKSDLSEARFAIGEIYLLQSDYISAIIAYRDYVNLMPNDPAGYYGLGKALAARDRTSEAIANLEKARSLYQQQGKQKEAAIVEKTLKNIQAKQGA
jgi:tetratricopeptide (TPR) repeat protein